MKESDCRVFIAKHVLIVLDEAPGVSADIYEAIEGIRAGGDVRVLALGNPTIASGPFYDAFTANREGWNLITISAFDTPNLQGLTVESLLKLSDEELDKNPLPYLTTRRWVKEKYREWGPGSSAVGIPCTRQFPDAGRRCAHYRSRGLKAPRFAKAGR